MTNSCSSYPSRVPYSVLKKRLKRRLYYGFKTQLDRLSFPLTELAINYFDKHSPFDSLERSFATSLSREACVNPSTLVVALLYLERVRGSDRSFFQNSDPANLYTTALLLANKYLFDQGEDDFIYNDEWAASANIPLDSVNKSELRLLKCLDWNLRVTAEQFEWMLDQMETKVALQQSSTRSNGFSYSDLTVLLNWMNICCSNVWVDLSEAIMKCVCGLSLAYAVGIVGCLTTVGISTDQTNISSAATHPIRPQERFNLHHNHVDHLSSGTRCQPDSLCFSTEVFASPEEQNNQQSQRSKIDPVRKSGAENSFRQTDGTASMAQNLSERSRGLPDVIASGMGLNPETAGLDRHASFCLPNWSAMKAKAIPIAT